MTWTCLNRFTLVCLGCSVLSSAVVAADPQSEPRLAQQPPPTGADSTSDDPPEPVVRVAIRQSRCRPPLTGAFSFRWNRYRLRNGGRSPFRPGSTLLT